MRSISFYKGTADIQYNVMRRHITTMLSSLCFNYSDYVKPSQKLVTVKRQALYFGAV